MLKYLGVYYPGLCNYLKWFKKKKKKSAYVYEDQANCGKLDSRTKVIQLFTVLVQLF